MMHEPIWLSWTAPRFQDVYSASSRGKGAPKSGQLSCIRTFMPNCSRIDQHNGGRIRRPDFPKIIQLNGINSKAWLSKYWAASVNLTPIYWNISQLHNTRMSTPNFPKISQPSGTRMSKPNFPKIGQLNDTSRTLLKPASAIKLAKPNFPNICQLNTTRIR